MLLWHFLQTYVTRKGQNIKELPTWQWLCSSWQSPCETLSPQQLIKQLQWNWSEEAEVLSELDFDGVHHLQGYLQPGLSHPHHLDSLTYHSAQIKPSMEIIELSGSCVKKGRICFYSLPFFCQVYNYVHKDLRVAFIHQTNSAIMWVIHHRQTLTQVPLLTHLWRRPTTELVDRDSLSITSPSFCTKMPFNYDKEKCPCIVFLCLCVRGMCSSHLVCQSKVLDVNRHCVWVRVGALVEPPSKNTHLYLLTIEWVIYALFVSVCVESMCLCVCVCCEWVSDADVLHVLFIIHQRPAGFMLRSSYIPSTC